MHRLAVLCCAALASSALAQSSSDAGIPPTTAQPDGGMSPEDLQLLKEIEALSTAPPKEAPPAPPASAAPAKSGGGAFSNIYNPALSVNGLFLASATSAGNPPAEQTQTGIAIQEMEVQLIANVDPYLSANLILALPGGEGIGVEEGYLVLTPQPLGIQLRGGKIKLPFGRENPLHTHALPFVERSLAGTAVFGEEGLSEVGVEGSYLVPVPWYLLLTAAVIDGSNEVAFHSPNGWDLAAFAALKNVFDLSDDATLELGASYAAGKNAARRLAQVAGAHLAIKWKPATAATTRSAVFTLEGMYSHNPLPGGSLGPDTVGLYGFVQWQLGRGLYVGGRGEYLRQVDVGPAVSLRESAILVFAPTEFSAVRLEAAALQPGGGEPQRFEAFLQLNFTIGAHPAHAY